MEENNALATQVFDFQGHPLHPFMHNGKAAFIGNELCKALGYKNPRQAMSKLPDHQKDKVQIQDSIGRLRNTPIVYEGGVYRLTFGSHLPNAEAFTDLVTDIILPTIRQTGSYSIQQYQELPPLDRVEEFSQVLDGVFRGDADAFDKINAKKLILGILWLQELQDVLYPEVPHKTLKEALSGAIQTICDAQEDAKAQLATPKRKQERVAKSATR